MENKFWMLTNILKRFVFKVHLKIVEFFLQFLSCTYEIIKEMESEWPEALKDVKLEQFTVEHDPCIKCMTMEYDDPLAVRLRNNLLSSQSLSHLLSVDATTAMMTSVPMKTMMAVTNICRHASLNQKLEQFSILAMSCLMVQFIMLTWTSTVQHSRHQMWIAMTVAPMTTEATS